MQSNKNVSAWTKDDWEQSSNQLNEICIGLVLLMQKGYASDSPEVQQLIGQHCNWLKNFWTPNKESYAGHADFITGTELKTFYDSFHPEFAQFMSDAIKIFAEKSL